MRVLIVEDEAYLAEAVREGLRQEAIAADVAGDGIRGLEMVDEADYDVVVLDRDLPGLHGDDVCRRLAARAEPPRILMLTASAALGERVEGLALGADDYLTKPFDFEELVARVLALYRRSLRPTPPVFEIGDLRLDTFRREAYRGANYLHLTRKEFAVLEVLMRAEGGTVSAEQLIERAWDTNADPFSNAIRVTVSTLRRKLGMPRIISTVTGVGYRIDAEGSS